MEDAIRAGVIDEMEGDFDVINHQFQNWIDEHYFATLQSNPLLKPKSVNKILPHIAANYQQQDKVALMVIDGFAYWQFMVLKRYLDKNLRVSVNTDDPGISRTCMTNELLKAGRLTHDGLSLWDIFSLLYNGFDTAFLPFEQKNELLADMNEFIRLWIDRNIGNVETELKERA
jgi:hypothetical protein